MDATLITEARTGAMTAVGAKHLARPDTKVLGHAGARGTAFSNVTMLDDAVRPRRDPGDQPAPGVPRGVRRAAAGRAPPPRCAVVDTVEEAFDGADILVEATRLTEPAPLLRTGGR